MSLFRKVHTEFWRDPKVLEELTPEDKLFFLYLLTNPNTTQVGIYKITKKQIAFELGYSQESINALIDRFENKYKIIKYNEQTREIAIKMWGKYNLDRGGKPMIDCVNKELKEVKDKSLITYISESIEKEEIKNIFNNFIKEDNDNLVYDTYNDTYHDTLYVSQGKSGQEEEKEEEQEKDKEEDKEVKVGKYVKHYEDNVGVINKVVKTWLYEISEKIDIELFKRAIEIATNRGKLNKAYINGIIKQWEDNNINSISKLKKCEVSRKNGDEKNYGGYTNKYSKSEYAKLLENEDESLYQKPSEEQLERVRRMLQE